MEEKQSDALRTPRGEAEPSRAVTAAPAAMTEDRLFYWIGRFIVEFQAIEYELRSILWFCDGAKFEWTRFGKTVGKAKSAIVAKLADAHAPDDMRLRVLELLQHCQTLADERNELVHSAFVQHQSIRGNDLVSVAYFRPWGETKPGYVKRQLTEAEFEQKWATARELYRELFELHRFLMYQLPFPAKP